MILFPIALVVGFAGGFLIALGGRGRWRLRLFLLWLALPLLVYSAPLIWLGEASDPGEALAWWLIGLFGFVGLPMLVFAGGALLGYFASPRSDKPWSLTSWRLPQ